MSHMPQLYVAKTQENFGIFFNLHLTLTFTYTHILGDNFEEKLKISKEKISNFLNI